MLSTGRLARGKYGCRSCLRMCRRTLIEVLGKSSQSLDSDCPFDQAPICTAVPPCKPSVSKSGIQPSVLTCVGRTPLVRLNNIPKTDNVSCQILAKCEFMNPGGSVKDRIALRMVEEAERCKKIRPGDTLIEPTSGNFGISLAIVCAIKGYRCVCIVPDKISTEKADLLTALGANVVRTSSTARINHPDSQFLMARRMQKEIQNSHILDQFNNGLNTMAHFDTTAEEILEACNNQIDMFVCGVGTGGSLSGIGRKIKSRVPCCKIIGVDPEGSSIAPIENACKTTCKYPFYHVEGIGYDFVPSVCDREIADRWYKSNDRESFAMTRRLVKEEGLLCGGSSGAAMDAAIKAAREYKLTCDQRVVVLLPDTARNYMSKFMNDVWMVGNFFTDLESCPDYKNINWWNVRICTLDLRPPLTFSHNVTIQEALDVMNCENCCQAPVINSNTHEIVGMITVNHMLSVLASGKLNLGDYVDKIVTNRFYTVTPDAYVAQIARLFETEPFVVVVHDQRQYFGCGSECVKTMVFAVVTRMDLLNYLANALMEPTCKNKCAVSSCSTATSCSY